MVLLFMIDFNKYKYIQYNRRHRNFHRLHTIQCNKNTFKKTIYNISYFCFFSHIRFTKIHRYFRSVNNSIFTYFHLVLDFITYTEYLFYVLLLKMYIIKFKYFCVIRNQCSQVHSLHDCTW